MTLDMIMHASLEGIYAQAMAAQLPGYWSDDQRNQTQYRFWIEAAIRAVGVY